MDAETKPTPGDPAERQSPTEVSTGESKTKQSVNQKPAPSMAAGSGSIQLADSDVSDEPWYKRRAFRVVALRLTLRAVMLGVIIALLRLFSSDFRYAGNAYLKWIESLGPGGGPAVFWVAACAFCALSPTGYLPAVAAGATFPHEDAIPIAYTSVWIGALLNLLLVRGMLGQSAALRARCSRRAGSTIGGLERALLAEPVRMVALLRLPFLGNGTLNYILSFTAVPLVPMMVGNAIGMAPGSVLFSVAGSQVRSLAQLIVDGGGSATAIGVFVAVTVTVLFSIVAVLVITRRVSRAERAKEAEEEATSGGADNYSKSEAFISPSSSSDPPHMRAATPPRADGATTTGPAPSLSNHDRQAASAPGPSLQAAV